MASPDGDRMTRLRRTAALLLLALLPPFLLLNPPLLVLLALPLLLSLQRSPPPGWLKLLLLPLGGVTLWLLPNADLLLRLVGLLLFLAALKLLECHSCRDARAYGLLAWILLACGWVLQPGLGWTLYLLVWGLLHLGWLLGLNQPLGRSLLRTQLALALAGLPLVLVLFLAVPRLPPLWNLRPPSTSATGLSDRVDPGSISRLARSGAIAFRFTLAGPAPPPPLYWRSMVHEQFDGRAWLRTVEAATRLPPAPGGRPYSVLLTDSRSPWLVSLDYSRADSPQIRATADGSFERLPGQPDLRRYEGRQSEDPRWLPPPRDPARLLALPPGNPRAIALAQDWWQQFPDPAQRLVVARDWFRRNDFRYTLRPPRLGSDPIDDFLFRSRRGFCEHYASSFTTLMRAAGIPARVVSGYLGGEYNRSGGFYEVRQYEAHAWSEVWLGDRWQRVDPTTWVVPERESGDLADSLDRQDRAELPSLALGDGLGWWHQQLSALDYRWSLWVLGASAEQQLQLWQQWLPWLNPRAWTSHLVLLLVGALGVGLVSWLLRSRPTGSPLQRAWLRLEATLSRRGFRRQPGEAEGPYLQRVASQLPPAAADALRDLGALYQCSRYGDRPPPHWRRQWRQLTRRLYSNRQSS